MGFIDAERLGKAANLSVKLLGRYCGTEKSHFKKIWVKVHSFYAIAFDNV